MHETMGLSGVCGLCILGSPYILGGHEPVGLISRLNRDKGYELPGCWIATVKKLGCGVSSSRASANRVSAWTSAPDRMRAQAQEPRL